MFVAGEPFPALSGNAPTTTAGGGDCGQPEVLVPLQVDPSIIETVRSSRFPMKTVFLSNTIPTPTRRRAGGKRGHHVLRRRVDYRNRIVVRVGNVERVIAGIKA